MTIIKKAKYFWSGIAGRFHQDRRCPSCKQWASTQVDAKYFHTMLSCNGCRLLYRYPGESASKMEEFYQNNYSEPGLTTELPSDEKLKTLIDNGFRGSEKDFSHHISLLRVLVRKENAKLLDYGANWGYASYQFQLAGFDTASYELSNGRAAFGKKLGINIHSTLDDVGHGFDIAFSSHVLEHVPDPNQAMIDQWNRIASGGYLVVHTPNGSKGYQTSNPKGFHLSWGQPHPVLLTDEFVRWFAKDQPYYMTSHDTADQLAQWDQTSQVTGDMTGCGFFFAIRKGVA
jgi:2-polyprenyl-3-methyl-5-hydroxy-6-metoxy-1,4-benzoquinol methylase